MLNRFITVISLMSVAVLLVLLNFTTPTTLGPVGVLLFFILVFVILLGVATGVVGIFRKILGKKGGMTGKDYQCAAVIAFAPIMLLLAQSLGNLSVLTVILTGMFAFLGCFLVLKRG